MSHFPKWYGCMKDPKSYATIFSLDVLAKRSYNILKQFRMTRVKKVRERERDRGRKWAR